MRTLRSCGIAFVVVAGMGGVAGPAAAQGGGLQAPPDYYIATSWQGWYAGLHAGWGDAGSADGFVGGAQAGYNWQSGRIVYGLEGDVTWSDISDSREFSVCGAGPHSCIDARASASIDWMATGRGRIGYLFQPGLLGYATVGFGHVSASASASVSGFGLTERVGISGSDTDFVYGVGVEAKLSPGTTARIEYLGFDDSNIDIVRAGINFKLGY
jgi:outer membrane immunogenic protein